MSEVSRSWDQEPAFFSSFHMIMGGSQDWELLAQNIYFLDDEIAAKDAK